MVVVLNCKTYFGPVHLTPTSIIAGLLWLEPSGGSSYMRGGGGLPPTPLYQKFGAPLDGNFKLYMDHCHRYPVNIFVISMRNSFFRLFILYDMFDELQLID